MGSSCIPTEIHGYRAETAFLIHILFHPFSFPFSLIDCHGNRGSTQRFGRIKSAQLRIPLALYPLWGYTYKQQHAALTRKPN